MKIVRLLRGDIKTRYLQKNYINPFLAVSLTSYTPFVFTQPMNTQINTTILAFLLALQELNTPLSEEEKTL